VAGAAAGGAPAPGPGPRANLSDVAKRAGVSLATASRGLRDQAHVAEPTRAKVLRAARELAYVASPMAAGLATGRSHAVGILVPPLTTWYRANAVAGACRVLAEAGYDVLLYHLQDDADRCKFFQRMPIARRVDAVLTVAMPLAPPQAEVLLRLGTPTVAVGERVAGIPCVRIDDYAAARTAVQHLVAQGHVTIAMLRREPRDREAPLSSSLDRWAGYQSAHQEAGISRQARYISTPTGAAGARQAIQRILAADPPITAVFGENDELALGALHELNRWHARGHPLIAVIGIDDHELSTPCGLTTIAQPARQAGEAAARMLLDALAGRQTTGPNRGLLPCGLRLRSSTTRPDQARSPGSPEEKCAGPQARRQAPAVPTPSTTPIRPNAWDG
jgi:LacI family repressor for deo operon, udp, cdd, tsx, nupC, and nupG